jgi:arabinose-5-phosphate isomerase
MNEKEQIQSFLNIEQEELKKFQEALDYESLKKAKDIILDAQKAKGRLHVTGIGKPGHIAGYAASLFSSTGTPAYELHGTEAVHGSSGQVLPGDVVIAISNSGQTEELKATVSTLLANGARVISVTRNPDSWLGQHAEVVLQASVDQEGDSLNKPPRASVLAEIIVLQALSILLQNAAGLTMRQYGKWHPGGSLGKSIREADHV